MMIGVVSFHASDGATRVYVRSFLFFSGSLDSSTCLESFMVYVNICIYTQDRLVQSDKNCIDGSAADG